MIMTFDLAWFCGRMVRVLKTMTGRKPVQDPPRFGLDLIGGDVAWVVRGARPGTREANAMNPVPPKHVA
jgi:hypothetical protein